MERVRIGVIGCGAVSEVYLDTFCRAFPDVVEVVACASQGGGSARVRAAQYGLEAKTTRELLADSRIELVVILTPVPSHAELVAAALAAGKHVYCEKTLAQDAAQVRGLLSLARARGLQLGCAPDTILCAAVQTARAALQRNLIGRVTSCRLCMNRDYGNFYERLPFLLAPGAGCGADIGPYFLTAAVYLLGALERVAGITAISRPQRTDSAGAPYTVPNENLFVGILQFACGALGTVHINADSGGPEQPELILYGTAGTLHITAPNKFNGRVIYERAGAGPARELAPVNPYTDLLRGIGAVEMAMQLCAGRPPRPTGAAALHTLAAIEAIYESSRTGRFCPVQAPLPPEYRAAPDPALMPQSGGRPNR